jgi:hypothetical protein
MTLRETQNEFTKAVALLIIFAYQKGYTLSFGDAWAKKAKNEHTTNSLHYVRCAIDLNLFRDGKFLDKTEDHEELGKFWESLNPKCRWGGHFSNVKDGNHYEMIP